MKYLYNLVLCIWALSILPLTVYQYFRHKKYRGNLLFRLGMKLPVIDIDSKRKRVWIHATSLGEAKAIVPFLRTVKEEDPNVYILFSCTTETGYAEAKKSLDLIDNLFFIPLDFSFIMKRLVKGIKPDLFVLVESDYWYNLFLELKRNGSRIALINGRISHTSYRNYRKVRSFAKKLFGMIDVLCVQNQEIEKRFLKLGIPKEKIITTGNVKFDVKALEFKSSNLFFPKGLRLITVASTHEKEELWILEALRQLDPSVGILLAPRHPERFEKVALMLSKMGIAYRRISENSEEAVQVILVDKIGVLEACFQNSALAIIGGSFVDNIGGHNIYEPVRSGIPVLYGPYMHKQQSLVNILNQFGIGKAVEIKELYSAVDRILKTKAQEDGKIRALKGSLEGATERSWKKIKELY